MTVDLDQKFDPPTREQLRGEVGGVALSDNGNPDHGPYIMFRAVCGGDGYFCSASFRDPEGYGGGATPREALRSLAKNLRTLAAKVEQAAEGGRCADAHCELPRGHVGPHRMGIYIRVSK